MLDRLYHTEDMFQIHVRNVHHGQTNEFIRWLLIEYRLNQYKAIFG